MAGRGRVPKAPDVRRNPVAPKRGEWVTLPVGKYVGGKPDLRSVPVDGGFMPASKAAWVAWWGSPMAHMWVRAQWPSIIRLLLVTEFVFRATKRGDMRGLSVLLTEARHLEDGLGISEKGRRDLRWALPSDETQPVPAVAQPANVVNLDKRRRMADV